MKDTRIRIYTLLDYETFYEKRELPKINSLIQNIPSLTLINYISGFNLNLYLRENDENTGKIQFTLANSLLSKCSNSTQQKWATQIKKLGKKGHSPFFIYSLSNLIFYEKIFENFNDKDGRDLTSEEAQRVFDIYLLINSGVNKKIDAKADEIKKLGQSGLIEKFTLTNFIYQKDYASSLDFSNQLTRGVEFFKYLENSNRFSQILQDYYKEKKVSDYKEMFQNLLWIFSNSGIEKDWRTQLIQISEVDKNYLNLHYLKSLFINGSISNYSSDNSFSILRNQFLFTLNKSQFFILHIDFLFDHFYKSQVFSFNKYLQDKSITKDFLSIKAKEFMEEIYVPEIFKRCFPQHILFFGEDCVNSSKEELCDIYVREKDKILLSEFKDVMLNAKSKNSQNESFLFEELEKKFEKNQNNKPKGITQLLNSIQTIEEESINFDPNLPNSILKIYPVIIYTDISFSLDGINKTFKNKFKENLQKLKIKNIQVNDITFINLSFFEFQENNLAANQIEVFELIDKYHEYCLQPEFALTPFEIFVRYYFEQNINSEENQPSQSNFYKTTLKEILK
ncbi:hypothetical protein [Salinimicrobium sp. GXAS 041]|uniref:hypothetical protein n=1 Tax=Salinimicrobium sp. GXAS 041 TaxID=3400806 RepID=UPI003C718883